MREVGKEKHSNREQGGGDDKYRGGCNESKITVRMSERIIRNHTINCVTLKNKL